MLNIFYKLLQFLQYPYIFKYYLNNSILHLFSSNCAFEMRNGVKQKK